MWHILECSIEYKRYFGPTYSWNILTVGLLITEIVLLMVDHLHLHYCPPRQHQCHLPHHHQTL